MIIKRSKHSLVPTIAAVTHWNEDRPAEAKALALLGKTDKEMAEHMGIAEITFQSWKKKHPEFLEALRFGKTDADAKVVEALYKRCIGYDYEEERAFNINGTIETVIVKKHCPPDTWAAMKWLALRQRPAWADVTKTEITQTNVNVNKLDLSDVSIEQLKLLKEIGLKQLTQDAEGG